MSEIQHVGDLDDARPLRSLCRRRVALAHVGPKRALGFVALMGAESSCDLPTGVQYDPGGRTILALSAPFSTAVIGAPEATAWRPLAPSKSRRASRRTRRSSTR
jgi:hypothetical protein